MITSPRKPKRAHRLSADSAGAPYRTMANALSSKKERRLGLQPGKTAPPRTDPEEWVKAYADDLFRHAVARVRHREIAEDLVQETFLSAWRSRNRFAGRSSEKTWLLGILRNKIADYYRSQSREVEFTDLDALVAFEAAEFHTT